MVSNMIKTAIVASVGVTVIVLSSTLGWILVPNLAAKEALLTSENEAVFSAWRIPPVPVFIDLFLFNCTNCVDPTDPNVKLNLQQLGPYRFSEGRIKFGDGEDQAVVEEDGMVIYKENVTYFHELGNLMDDVISINPIYFTLASLIADYAPPDRAASISAVMHQQLNSIGEGPFMKHKAGEMLFDGWDVQGYVDIIKNVLDMLGVVPPFPLPESAKFGYFYGKNGSNLGSFTIESGINGLSELGYIREWEGKQKLNYWNDTYCDMINGTDGALYPPLVNQYIDDPLYIFTPDLCRSIYGTYEKDVTTEGIVGHRFTIPDIVFGNVTDNPDNLCYCRNNSNIDNCFKAGILDMRPCSDGAPILLSTPHFYLGDEMYVNAFTGLKPIKEEHETHFDLEPLLGVPVFASKKIQINIDVRRYEVPKRFLNLNNTVFPVFWLNETAKLDSASASDVNDALNVINALNISRWCFLGAGITLVIASVIMLIIYFPR